MKSVFLLLVMSAAAYFFYTREQEPVEITNPVYVEIRLDMPVENRQLDFLLVGKMAGAEDCEKRSDRVWGKVIDGCPTCTLKISACKADLEPRYLRLFDDQPINTAYLTFTRGNAGERDGRMVIWGVTAEEGNAVCDAAKAEFAKRYKGDVACVAGKAQ